MSMISTDFHHLPTYNSPEQIIIRIEAAWHRESNAMSEASVLALHQSVNSQNAKHDHVSKSTLQHEDMRL